MTGLVVVVLAAASGCSGELGPPDTPGAAYEQLFSAMRRKDMDAVLRCVDEPTARFLKAAQDAVGTEKAFTYLSGSKAQLDRQNLTVTDVSIEGNVAQVTISWSAAGRGQQMQQTAVRSGDGWVASMFHGMPEEQVEGMIDMIRAQGAAGP
jgi:ketosteroid isomerase-like protein